MFRVVFPEGDIDCARYDQTEYGVELYNENDELMAFVPYSNLIAVLNQEVDTGDEPSIA